MRCDWPSWQKGRALHADDLLGLEDYLLARNHFKGNDWGVDEIGENSVTISVEATTTTVKVDAIRGLTRSGQPVIVDSPIEQTLTFEVSSKNRLDVVLLLNEPVENELQNSLEEDGHPPIDSKMSIQVELDSAPHHQQPLWQKSTNGLFLGTYECKAGETQLCKKPRVRSLGVLEHLADWKEWTQPLVDELAALVAQHSRPPSMAAAQLASQQLLLALHRWKQLTVSEWTHLADILSWTAKLQPHRWKSQAYMDTFSNNTDDWQSDDLPKNIMGLFHGLLEQRPDLDLGEELIKGEDYEYKKMRGIDVIIKLSASLQGAYLSLRLSTLNGVGEGTLPRLTQPDYDGFMPRVGKIYQGGYVFDEIKVNTHFEYVVKNVDANDESEVKLYKPIT